MQAYKQASKQTIKQASIQKDKKSVSQSVSQSVNQSINQSIKQSIKQTNKRTNKHTNKQELVLVKLLLSVSTTSKTCKSVPVSKSGFYIASCFRSPVDGGYSSWSAWNACTVSCGGGTRTRTRACNNPAPRNGGKTCSARGLGNDKETQACNKQGCPGEYDVCCLQYS